MLLFELVEKDKRILIDPEDLTEHAFKTAHVIKRDNIVHVSFGSKGIGLHRLILGDKEGFIIDHENRNSLDNRRLNLRHVTYQGNSRNMSKHYDGSGEYKGVGWHNQRNCWRAYIWDGTKQIALGLFKDPKLAALAYNRAAIRLFGEYASLNEIA